MTEHSIVTRLRGIVGADHTLTDDDLRAGYERDWTGRFTGTCAAVLRPGTLEEVAAVLAICNDNAVDVIPQGGNTGLVGGGVPRPTATRPVVVLSTRRLDRISDVDAAAMQLTAGAGVTFAEWRRAARGTGLDTPVDFASRESATIGGAIATNAGGSRVLRFGTMRQQVVGIQAVLADGRVVGSMAGLPKETVGLHWPSVLSGSEGTLAVVTAARLRLVPHFDHVATAMVSLATLTDALALAAGLRRNVGSLDALEIIEPEAMQLVSDHLGATPPVEMRPNGTVLLIECADHDDPTAELLDHLATASGVAASAVVDDPIRRDQIVRFRDRITEAIGASAGAPPYKLDVAVPIGSLGVLLEVARGAASSAGARLIAFGHVAEGNLHLNFLGVTDSDAIADPVLAAVADLGGTISAEHGIGIAKSRWLHLVRGADDLAAQRAIKLALDPNQILNPGVLDAQVP